MRPRWRRAAVLAVGLAGCGRAPNALSDTLRLPLINDPIMNPVLAPDIGSILINKVVFPGLVRPDEALQPTPDLAESWTVSPDGKAYTFRLRAGVFWHDGQPFTARDVTFTFDQILDPKSGTLLWSDFSAVSRVEALDSFTVRFLLEAPFAPFLTLLGHNAGIIPEHAFRGRRILDATDFSRSQPIGTGPFRVVATVPGSSITLDAYGRYHGAKPGIARMVFRITPDLNAQVAQFRAGELDLITVEPANLGGLEHAAGIRIERVEVPQHYYVGFNQRLPLFKSAAVRRALVHAVNRRAIIAGVLKGYGDEPRGTIPVVLREYFADSLPVAEYDTARALTLLREAGWQRGPGGLLRDRSNASFRFTLLLDKGNPSREQAALAVQQDLRRIGMEVDLRTLEFAALVRDYIQPGNFEAYLIWWNTPLDPDQYSYYATGQPNNNAGYSNRAADSLLLLGRHTTDPIERRRIYREFQAVEAEDPPVLVLYYPREIQMLNTALRGMSRLGLRDALRHSERFYFKP